jgi:hypothetical protein
MKGLCHVCHKSNVDVTINDQGVAFCGDHHQDCTGSEKQ